MADDMAAKVARIDAQLGALQRKVDRLEAENAALRGRLVRGTPQAAPSDVASVPTAAHDAEPVVEGRSFDRRRLLLGGATAGAAAVAAVVASSTPAAAANGDPLVLGQSNGASSPTIVQSSVSSANAFGFFGDTSGYVLGGLNDQGIGVWGQSVSATAVFAISTSGAGAFGQSDTNVGVKGDSLEGVGTAGLSVSAAGLEGRSSSGVGLDAESQSSYGARLRGGKADLRFDAVPSRQAPTADAAAHLVGEVVADASGALWHCVVAGTPGTWRKLGGPGTAGQLHVLPAPARVYDSRPSTSPSQGPKTKLTGNVARTIDLKVNNSGVPAGATAALLTVLLVDASNGNGNLTIWANGVTRPAANTMVWGTGSGRYTASTVTALDAAARCQVAASALTNVVLDVVGYYR
jgi:hypothetical protein